MKKESKKQKLIRTSTDPADTLYPEFMAGLEAEPNPMVGKAGKGPAGKKCRSCSHLFYHERARRYYKCEFRGCTHGPGTDHRIGWNACKLFKEEEYEQPAGSNGTGHGACNRPEKPA